MRHVYIVYAASGVSMLALAVYSDESAAVEHVARCRRPIGDGMRSPEEILDCRTYYVRMEVLERA